MDSSNNLYMTSGLNNNIEKFDSSGHGTIIANSGLNEPIGLAFDSSGNLYVANHGNNTIEKFDSTGHGTIFASGLAGPMWVAVQIPEPSTWALLTLGTGTLLGSLRLRRCLS